MTKTKPSALFRVAFLERFTNNCHGSSNNDNCIDVKRPSGWTERGVSRDGLLTPDKHVTSQSLRCETKLVPQSKFKLKQARPIAEVGGGGEAGRGGGHPCVSFPFKPPISGKNQMILGRKENICICKRSKGNVHQIQDPPPSRLNLTVQRQATRMLRIKSVWSHKRSLFINGQ